MNDRAPLLLFPDARFFISNEQRPKIHKEPPCFPNRRRMMTRPRVTAVKQMQRRRRSGTRSITCRERRVTSYFTRGISGRVKVVPSGRCGVRGYAPYRRRWRRMGEWRCGEGLRSQGKGGRRRKRIATRGRPRSHAGKKCLKYFRRGAVEIYLISTGKEESGAGAVVGEESSQSETGTRTCGGCVARVQVEKSFPHRVPKQPRAAREGPPFAPSSSFLVPSMPWRSHRLRSSVSWVSRAVEESEAVNLLLDDERWFIECRMPCSGRGRVCIVSPGRHRHLNKNTGCPHQACYRLLVHLIYCGSFECFGVGYFAI